MVGGERARPDLISERDLLTCNGSGQRVDEEVVRDHVAGGQARVEASWPLPRAAALMARAGRRHVIVMDGSVVVGILSMRDIVSAWTADGATCELPGA